MIFYVGRTILSQYSECLSKIFGERKEHHITLAYSRLWFPYKADLRPTLVLRAPFELSSFGTQAVLLLKDKELEARHEALLEAGAQWDHSEYRPHISVGDIDGTLNLSAIVAGQEYYGTWDE